MNSRPIVNITAYRFVDLTDAWIRDVRQVLRQRCELLDLKGTIILSKEGINLFVSGTEEAVTDLRELLSDFLPFAGMTYKVSYSADHSFRRMLVKIKREIIPFGLPEIRPVENPAPRVPPATLKRWLDEHRDVVLLDTRNAYEVELGSFREAINLNIKSFRAFSEAATKLDERLKQKPVVTFCTGGIRCEKAAPSLKALGFREVYQLDGGILNYFDKCGGEHWNGECFVFDGRVAVNTQLEETDAEFCYRCQHVLSVSDRTRPEYVENVSCPYCYSTAGRTNEEYLDSSQATTKRA